MQGNGQYPMYPPIQMTQQHLPYAQNNNNLDQNSFNACNQGIANGFGAMFFNVRDPAFRKTNEPIKQSTSKHVVVIITTIILIVAIVIGIIGLNRFFGIGGTIGLIAGSYILYVILSICCSTIRPYLINTKLYDDYSKTYAKMVQGAGYFTFWIECYHYVTVRTKKGTKRRKVVTHTATETFNVTASFDESGQIGSIKDIKDIIFIHYLKRFYFTDDISQQRFIQAFNNFVSRHRRDTHQNYTHTFNFHGYEEFASFTALNGGGKSLTLFYVFTLIGLGLVYACIIERSIGRYDVGILKRLTI